MTITHPDKVLFPDDGITKRELAAYYDAVAPFMLPHLRRRPITMERFPGGIGGKGFLQKNVVKGYPPWLKRVEAAKKGGTVHYPLAGDRRSLQWLANQNAITLHVWASRAPRLDRPDLCIFDLDPAHDDAEALRTVVLGLRDLLAEAGVDSAVKTSGSKGFHVVVPLKRSATFDTSASVCRRGGRRSDRAPPAPGDAGVQQGRSRRPNLRRHRPQSRRRHLRRGLHRARASRRAGLGAVHAGRKWPAARSDRRPSRCAPCRSAWHWSAICGLSS